MSVKAEILPLTGLRGIAALLVVFSHYAYFCAPFPRAEVSRLYDDATNLSGFGMSLFFVLSGFVITYNYAAYPWGALPARSFSRFLYFRLSRLYPALLLFILYIAYKTDPAARDLRVWVLTLLHIFSAQSWLPIVDHGSVVSNGTYHLSWSISTEIMMYMIFAGAIITVARRGALARGTAIAVIILVVAAIASLGCWVEPISQLIVSLPQVLEPISLEQAKLWFFYLSPWFRVVDFAAGGLAAIAVMSGVVAQWRGLFAIAAAASAIFVIGFHIWRTAVEASVSFITVQLDVVQLPSH